MALTRYWCSLEATWIPIYVSLDHDEFLDPLEEAALALLNYGMSNPRQLANELCLDEPLIDSALSGLELRNLARNQDGAWKAVERLADLRAPADREGWIAWDPVSRMVIPQVWLGPFPETPPLVPPGWGTVELRRPEHRDPELPREDDISRSLALVANLDECRLIEATRGAPVYGDPAAIRRLSRRRRGSPKTVRVWIPLEFRVGGPVVWRPSLLPVQEPSTSLAPGGWKALLEHVDAASQQRLRSARIDAPEVIAPGLLNAVGFASVEEMKADAHRRAGRALAGVKGAQGWQLAEELVHEAMVQGTVAVVLDQPWRAACRPWADVLEELSAGVAEIASTAEGTPLLPAVLELPVNEAKRAINGAHLPGSVRGDLLSLLSDADRLKALARAVESRSAIGDNLVMICLHHVFSPDARRRLEPIFTKCPSFLEQANTARKERNQVVHGEDARASTVDPTAFQERVLALLRAVMVVPRMPRGPTLPPAQARTESP